MPMAIEAHLVQLDHSTLHATHLGSSRRPGDLATPNAFAIANFSNTLILEGQFNSAL